MAPELLPHLQTNWWVALLCDFISINGRNNKFLACRLIAIPFWQWDDKDIELQADVDRFVEDGSLDDNVESFLSHDDTDPRDPVGRMDVSKGAVNTNILSIIIIFTITCVK